MQEEIPWWQSTTVYQIYPRSFFDSNDDGIGDLEGIISKLDYLQNLGIETIWFSPFYKSPQIDFGYDIADYYDIAPEYGTMEQCEMLIKEIHKREMKIVLDLVLNHTSDKHPWFIESRSSRDNPKRDWYIWRDGKDSKGKKKPGKKPPTNWKSYIGKNGWHYDSRTDQWYWSQFLACQPDLNYRNPEVKSEIFKMIHFWLDKGIDGFRLDIIDAVYEDAEFRDNPMMLTLFGSEKKQGMLFQSTQYTRHHPDSLKFVRELRNVIDEYKNPERFLVGEVAGPISVIKQYCGIPENPGLNLVFLFQSLGVKMNAAVIRKLILKYEFNFQLSRGMIPTWVFSNHDVIRRISRFNGNLDIAKLNAALQLTVRGIPFIYYGEEIGMIQNNIPFQDSKDPVSFPYKKWPFNLGRLVDKIMSGVLNRDNCRTPMQWNSEDKTAGFCSNNVDPWLPITSNSSERNVESMDENPDSLLACYRRFLKIRKENLALNSGSIELEDADSKTFPKYVLAFRRIEPVINGNGVNEKINVCYVLLNFSKKPQTIPFAYYEKFIKKPVPKLLISTTIFSQAFKYVNNKKNIMLQPFEAIIFQI